MKIRPCERAPIGGIAFGLVVAMTLAWMFGRPLLRQEVFAFRDAGNFFYPLFAWECSEWRAGRVPLWNPYDQLGVPVMADATSSVLYPGKLLFALPVPYPIRFNLYVIGHLLLAGWNSYSLARRWSGGIEASVLCATSYVLGGHVLFQYCNVVYLVSAAWLPLAVYLASQMLQERRLFRSAQLGAVWALMVLGGDPQTAYHAGILAAVQAVLQWRSSRSAGQADGDRQLSGSADNGMMRRGSALHSFARRSLMLLAFATLAAFSFAAIQILPSAEWAKRSERNKDELPRDIFGATRSMLATADAGDGRSITPLRRVCAGLFGNPTAPSHAADIYRYSLGPWRLAELVWPNVAGKAFPIHRRWLSGLPAEGRFWVPSLYCGLVTSVCAFCALRWRGNDWRTWSAIAMVGIGILASFGWYGLGWLARELALLASPMNDLEKLPGHPVGGLYWFFVTFLPRYSLFRYPAKWFVFASLGMSLLAARGLDAIIQQPKVARILSFVLAATSLSAAFVAALVRGCILSVFRRVPASVLWGPIDADAAWRDLFIAFIQSGAVSLGVWLLMHLHGRGRIAAVARWLVVLSLVDLAIANGWFVVTLPASMLVLNDLDLRAKSATPPERVFHQGDTATWGDRQWQARSSVNRVEEIARWEQTAMLHKYHLSAHQASLSAPSTLVPSEIETVWRELQTRLANDSADELLAALSVSRIVESSSGEIEFRPNEFPVLPKAWIVHTNADTHFSYTDIPDIPDTHLFPRVQDTHLPTSRISWRDSDTHFSRLWYDEKGAFRDPRSSVVAHGSVIDNPRISSAQPSAELCEVVSYEPQSIVIHVRLQSAGLLVVNDLFDTSWKTKVVTAGADDISMPESVRVNGLIRGVGLSAGDHRVTMRYLPSTLWIGGSVSLAAWLIFFAVMTAKRKRNSREN